ncbi:globin [Exilibacterium tricleocarpae]|uniref:Globin n=1 Tax=Exilibacterium tricleocarpae TaxID=2591008 RepID=A0A545UA08_9GAMM|nr:globin [Exilibacterium tricleocarpae]TQV86302.1 globin [Exilibacterium tricleocarpae]
MQFEEIFDASYERVLRVELEGRFFFDAFYENFIDSSPEVRDKFKNTDMDRQRKMLKKSFYSLVVFYATNSVDDYLVKVAERHNRENIDIRPGLYDLWIESLIFTVAQYDPDFDETVELAWRLVLATGITYMKFKYNHR